jgi:NADPH:quinone reductase-like Zn-dependent oxidoreductase
LQVHFNLVAVRRALQPAFLRGGHRRFRIVGVKSNAEDLKQIGQWMDEGKVKPIVEVFEWENVPEAFAKVKYGHAVGKVIIRVAKP